MSQYYVLIVSEMILPDNISLVADNETVIVCEFTHFQKNLNE